MSTRCRISLLALLFGMLETVANAQSPVMISTAGTQPLEPDAKPAVVVGILTFREEAHDFGEMERGGDASWKFEFTNTGTAPILIESAKTNCGCLVASFPRDPIQPGESYAIAVKYDTNRIGPFFKHVYVVSNASRPEIRLQVTGTIVPAPDYHAPIEAAPNTGGH